jgi:lysophospholipase L1-like esterase
VKSISWIAIAWLAFSFAGKAKIKIFMAGDSTMAIKETRAYPETGWGMPFTYFWDSTVTVVNRAKNGRSSKTFISEGLWKSIMDASGEGDYIFIQFGHNDESVDKKERYSTPDTFKLNLAKFITDARFKKAVPVLITPVGRRKFDAAGQVMETHADYSRLTKEVAAEQKVILIDLDSSSQRLYQSMGKDGSKLLFLQLKPGEHPNYPAGKEDNTHFNELGARLIAQQVLEAVKTRLPELADRLVKPRSN